MSEKEIRAKAAEPSRELPACRLAPELRPRTRFVTAASLFDGHDASINIMRRILQASGAEVIHLGHNRSVQEIVQAAVQEDAQAIAVSSYQGGHVEYFKYIIDLLKKEGVPHIRVFGGGGGTITLAEIAELEKYGVTKLYSPEDGRKMGLQGLIDHMLAHAAEHPLQTIQWERLPRFAESYVSLAQALTCLELGEARFRADGFGERVGALQTLQTLISRAPKKSRVIGMTGTGGAGKSSLADELMLRILQNEPNARVAMLAIDPTRRKTGGALLGDRLRMNSLKSPRCFMRSFATREANVSLSQATGEAVKCLIAAGFDWIFVETGGIGQADTAIVDLVDANVYVMTSEFGAPTQLEKINMLDYAAVVVLNKFEKAGALDALMDVRKQLRRNHPDRMGLALERFPVFGTIASRFADPGVDAVYRHLRQLGDGGPAFRPLADGETTAEPSTLSIVPKDRVLYLSEIATTVRGYHERVKATAAKVAEIEGLERLLENGTDWSPGTREELKRSLGAREQALDPEVAKELAAFPELSARYRQDFFTYQVREQKISVPLFTESLSHNKIRKVTPPSFLSKAELTRFLMLENLPGYFPYTAGVFPFRRTEEDPKRQFAGEGTPTRTNKRFHLLSHGEKAKRLSTAFDSVTLYGQDPDERPDIYGKIGESGVSVCSLDDAKKLYAGFDLCSPDTSVSMTINGPAPMLLAFFFNTAIDQQVERFRRETGHAPGAEEYAKIKRDTLERVRGTVQADILKEDQAQNTCIFSTEFALRMMGDIQQYFIDQ